MRTMHRAILMGIVMALVLVALPAPTAAMQPQIWLWPDEGPPGTHVYVDGGGFTPGSEIAITFDGEPIDTDPEEVAAGSGGWFWVEIVVPDVPYGDYTIRATDGDDVWAEAPFTVGPRVFIHPSSGPVSASIEVVGEGFTPESEIMITFDGETMETDPEEVITGEAGWFVAHIMVPDVPYGDYTVVATDGEGLSAERVFAVAPPSLSLSPSAAPAGGLVTIHGHHFTPGSYVTATFDGRPIETDPEILLTNERGYFRADVIVPEVPLGEYVIEATDGEGLKAERLLAVAPPWITVSSDWAPAGAPIRMSGRCFTPDSEITITLNGEPADTEPEVLLTNASGRFSWAEVLIPDVPDGDYVLAATDGEGLSVETVFTVGLPPPGLLLLLPRGPVGIENFLLGWGFTPDSNVAITWDGEPIDALDPFPPPDPIPTATSTEGTGADDWGMLFAMIGVPDSPQGYYLVEASDEEGLSAATSFEVLSRGLFMLPAGGPAGSWGFMFGWGLTPNSSITLTWDGEPIDSHSPAEEVVTDSEGGFWAYFIVPEAPDGSYTIRATDEEGLWAEAVFVVSPSGIGLLASRGVRGSLVLAYAWGFTQWSDIAVTWEGAPVRAYSFSMLEDFFPSDLGITRLFAVPSVPAGDYTVGITTGDQPAVETTFTVLDIGPAVSRTLTITSTAGGSVTNPGEETFSYDEGTVVNLVAQAEDGYRFVNWTGDTGTIATTNAATTTIAIHGDYEITANFAAATGCFIATAAYGTPMADEIQILRELRDGYLLAHPLGQAFVDLYYTTSPPIAEFISEHPGLRPVVRAALVPAVGVSTIVVNTSPAGKAAIAGLAVLASVTAAAWIARRRSRAPECL